MLSDIKPLDCIFFKGSSCFSRGVSETQKLTIGKGDWTHVGIVINRQFMPSLRVKDKKQLYLWESGLSSKCKLFTSDNLIDEESGKNSFGVEIRKLQDVLKNTLNNKEKIGWGRLKNNPLYRKPEEGERDHMRRLCGLKDKLDDLHIDNYGRSYPKNFTKLFAALLPGCIVCRNKDDKTMFCSEFVSTVYKTLEILDERFDPAQILPQDLATPDISHERLPNLFEDLIEIDDKWLL